MFCIIMLIFLKVRYTKLLLEWYGNNAYWIFSWKLEIKFTVIKLDFMTQMLLSFINIMLICAF